MTRLFIFDMGGVLATNVFCVAEMSASLGLTQKEFFQAAGAASGDGNVAHDGYFLGDVLAIQEGSMDIQTFWTRFQERSLSLFPGRTVVVPRDADGKALDLWDSSFHPDRDLQVEAVIRSLRDAGFRAVCGTNTLDSHYRTHLRRGDYGAFDAVYASHLMGVAKPKAEFWLRILESESCTPEEAFFVDDSAANVAAAEAVGLRGHRFTGASSLIEALSLARTVSAP